MKYELKHKILLPTPVQMERVNGITLTINFFQWNCIRIVGYAIASTHLLKCLQTFHTATHQLCHVVKSKLLLI